LKSLDLSNPAIDEVILAYAINNKPLPLLNSFPLRVVVPGCFTTYWLKSLTSIRVLDKTDDNFWMKTAHRIPDTPRGNTTPNEFETGKVQTVPIAKMPVRSFLISPDGSDKVPPGFPLLLQGIAFSGNDGIRKVEVSDDNGANWHDASLGEHFGPIRSTHGNLPGLQCVPAGIRLPFGRRMEAEICSPMMGFGIQVDICGTRSSDK
jgi:hypothetical protein